MGKHLGPASEEKPNRKCFFSAWPPLCLPALLCMLQQQGELGPKGHSPSENKAKENRCVDRLIWTATKLASCVVCPPFCILIERFKIISPTLGGNLLVCEYLIWCWLCLYFQTHYHGEILGFFKKRRDDEMGYNILEPGKKYWIELANSQMH